MLFSTLVSLNPLVKYYTFTFISAEHTLELRNHDYQLNSTILQLRFQYIGLYFCHHVSI